MTSRKLTLTLCFGFVLATCGTALSAGKVPLRDANWKQVEQLIKQHQGKIVVVDIWTSTCPCCLKKFPEFVAMQETFAGKKVVFISVNCDYDGIKTKPPKFYRPKVITFLRKHKATFQNVLLTVPFIDFLEQINLGSTPAMLVYGPNGKLARRFDNEKSNSEADDFQMKDVTLYVKKLVTK